MECILYWLQVWTSPSPAALQQQGSEFQESRNSEMEVLMRVA